jgi:hypothetical protein
VREAAPRCVRAFDLLLRALMADDVRAIEATLVAQAPSIQQRLACRRSAMTLEAMDRFSTPPFDEGAPKFARLALKCPGAKMTLRDFRAGRFQGGCAADYGSRV